MTIAMTLAFATWMVLLNNFVVERASFSGKEIGILQSIREIPGFLAFTTIFILLLIREQKFAYVSLVMLGIGVLITGFFPSALGLYPHYICYVCWISLLRDCEAVFIFAMVKYSRGARNTGQAYCFSIFYFAYNLLLYLGISTLLFVQF